ncbi:ABC transporter permease [Pseudoponticoccus marisrubri]|uniref:Spermidine/putrescine ABC transporter permease n=1 Tax=Pseudoponticoccus marisrubri TaxID=1685382 RepID=A0A0W7WJU8_9RHOB|nr:ABC transporter permease [Pseudoponticoccus marisrubri]KUF10896.1 spermidine/putrescine ABC transporter permease [Pseudoponticoccus marisrubri]
MTYDASAEREGRPGARPAADPTFWGRLTGWGPYHVLMRIATASPRRQFAILAAFPILWVLTQHLGPMLQMLRVSLTDAYPVAPGVEQSFTLENYARFFGDSIFWMPFFRTLTFAAVFTFCTLVITYPVAYFLARHVSRRNQMLFLLLLLIPFWVGEIVRTYAIMILLGNTGAVNMVLRFFGLIDRPIPFMYTSFSMGVGIVYLTALYMLLPLYSALEKLPKSMNEAAADLGAGAWTRFRRISLPMTIEGISSGCTLVFLISTGFYATPILLGGPSTTVFAETIAGFFHVAGDEWPTGAAFATIMFAAALVITAAFQRLMNALRKGDRT